MSDTKEVSMWVVSSLLAANGVLGAIASFFIKDLINKVKQNIDTNSEVLWRLGEIEKKIVEIPELAKDVNILMYHSFGRSRSNKSGFGETKSKKGGN